VVFFAAALALVAGLVLLATDLAGGMGPNENSVIETEKGVISTQHPLLLLATQSGGTGPLRMFLETKSPLICPLILDLSFSSTFRSSK